jgi:transposase
MRAPSRYPKRQPSEWPQLRQTALTHFVAGKRPASVARALNISHETARRWCHHWHATAAALPRRPHGPQPRLGPEQLAELERQLLRGPLAQGYATDLWTLARIADLIRKLFGVRHHPSHVFRLLRGLGWSCQKPEQRAKERDEAAIQRWVRADWPALKKGP